MNVTIENGVTIRGDLVLLAIKRTDLTAIPSTVELLIRADEKLLPYIAEGKTITVGDEYSLYRIVLSERQAGGEDFMGNPNYTTMKVIAILKSCYEIAFIKNRAIIEYDSTLGAIYRACGANVSVDRDIKISKFVNLIGTAPAYSIQKSLQLAGAAIMWDMKNKISFMRYADLFKQKPTKIIATDNTIDLTSPFLEKHEAPAHYTNNADGSISSSSNKIDRSARFELFADAQELNNLSSYLVQKKTLTTPLDMGLNAGNIVTIGKTPYVTITAVHVVGNSAAGVGSQMSRFWLGECVRS